MSIKQYLLTNNKIKLKSIQNGWEYGIYFGCEGFLDIRGCNIVIFSSRNLSKCYIKANAVVHIITGFTVQKRDD